MNQSDKLVLFDFDGTITKQDTLFLFTRFAVGDFRFIVGLIILFIPLALQKLKILSAQRAKEIFLRYFFKDSKIDLFNKTCHEFSVEIMPKELRADAIEMISYYRKNNYRVIIVSASPENWIQPWALKYGIEVIATQLEIKDGRLTGYIAGINCNGEEKVNRVKQYVDLNEYYEIAAYGDSKGDKPMLALAHQAYYKPFRT